MEVTDIFSNMCGAVTFVIAHNTYEEDESLMEKSCAT